MSILLLSFSGLLATKCTSLKNETCLARATLIDLKPNELQYHPFMISLSTCNGSCNTHDDPSARICVPSKTRCKCKCI